MISELTWDSIAMVLAVCALAASSMTEIVRKLILQGVIERNKGADKPWWRGTVLRSTSVVCGAGFGVLMVNESWRMGLLLGIGAGSLTTEAVGFARRAMRAKANGSDIPGEAKPGAHTEFQVAISEDQADS